MPMNIAGPTCTLTTLPVPVLRFRCTPTVPSGPTTLITCVMTPPNTASAFGSYWAVAAVRDWAETDAASTPDMRADIAKWRIMRTPPPRYCELVDACWWIGIGGIRTPACHEREASRSGRYVQNGSSARKLPVAA